MNGEADAPIFAGLRAVEIASWVAAPTVGAILAEYGADVTHIEDPARADPHRTNVSQAWKKTVADTRFNTSYELNNRNKRSLAVSLRSDEGKDIFCKLIGRSDVFITNLLPDRQQRLGIDYPALKAISPRIIHVGINGWGSKGPFRLNRAFDLTVYWAASSMMSLLRVPGAPPTFVRPGMGDRATGMSAMAALAMALYHRERTGKGQAIEVSLMHAGMWALASDVQRAVVFGQAGPNYSRAEAPGPTTNSYETRDKRWLMINIGQDHWKTFCDCIDHPELVHDPRFADSDLRGDHHLELIGILDHAFARHDLAEWTRRLNTADITWAPGLEPLEAANHPQAVENDFFIDAHNTAVGDYKMITFPFRLSGANPRFRNQAPEAGAQTRDILTELGFTPERIQVLAASGVVGIADSTITNA